MSEPGRGDPLRLAFQHVDLVQQLVVGAVHVLVNDDEVEVMAVLLLHLPGLLYGLLQLLVLWGRIEVTNGWVEGSEGLSIVSISCISLEKTLSFS